MSGPPELPKPEPLDAYGRLERRLARERHARLEAEAIAEKGLRELWSGQRELRLLKTVANAANQAKTSREALAETLRLVCEFSEWPIGHVYMTRRTRRGRVMAPTDIWCGADAQVLQAFRRESEALQFAGEEGLPGRVLASGRPAWTSPLALDPQFPRAKVAVDAGLGSGLAFPVLIGSRVAAVLEFFTNQVLEPDEKLLELMAKVGDHLGRAVEREQAEARLKEKNRKLSHALRQVEAQRRQAEAASAAKSMFLAVTSHEVRTPLNAVLGLAEGLRREELTSHQTELVGGIIESGSMLLRLLNAVLELSRIESGDVALEESDFTVADLMTSVVRLWQGRAEELDVDLRLETDALPAACWVRGDRGKLEQVVMNLLSNALKFTGPGTIVTARAAARLAHGRVSLDLEVEDAGPGVADESKAAIFEPYAQTSAGRDAGGAGLGLSICAGHVAQMGGEIRVEDSPGGGAIFGVRLALAQGEPHACPVLADPAAAPPPARLRILVAEDNEPNRHVLKVLLAPAEAELTFAENGAEALEAFGREVFDLVLMDANMPVMGGVEAVRAIRALPGPRAKAPIYMLTANAFEEDVRTYMAAGADGVLAKPVRVHELYATLSAVMTERGLQEPDRRTA